LIILKSKVVKYLYYYYKEMYYSNKHKRNAYIESYDNIPDNF